MDNKNFEERFKAFLKTLPEDKRNELFRKLKSMEPAAREQAIVKILKAYEDRLKTRTAGQAQTQVPNRPNAAPQAQQQRPAQPKPAQQPQRPAPRSNTAQVAMSEAQRKAASEQRKNAVPYIDGNPQKPVRPMRPQQPQGQANKPHDPKADRRKDIPSQEISAGDFARAEDTRDELIEEAFDGNHENNKRNVVKDIIIVVSILVVFVGACFALKIFLDKHIDEVNESISSEASESSAVEASQAAAQESEQAAAAETEPAPSETEPTPTPEPTKVPLKEDAPDLTGLLIVIDPGHQAVTSEESEGVSTNSNSTKPRATSGSTGVVTGIHEYELTLDIAIMLKDYLEQCGAQVILTREVNEIDISNQERAEVAVSTNADLFLRLHADAANDSLESGVKVFVPDSGNYVSSNSAWADNLGNKVAEALGLTFNGTVATDIYTGLNYANTIPSFQICLGLLSNSDDEAILTNPEKQVEACAAMAQFASEFMPESGEATE